MKPPNLAVLLLPPLAHAATATTVVTSSPAGADQPERTFEASASSCTAATAQCDEPPEGDGDEVPVATDGIIAATPEAKIQQETHDRRNDYEYDYGHDYDYGRDRFSAELAQKVALEQIAASETPPTLEQMQLARGCYRLPNVGRPLYTEEDWQRLRKLYKEQGGGTIRHQNEPPADYVLPMRAGHTSDGKGRGVFATRDINRGEMTYGGVKNYAYFSDGASYRRFLDALSVFEACDIMMWSWTEVTKWQPVILVLLDDNALQNSGDGDEANTGSHPDDHSPYGMFDEFAQRDIKEGEELLCDYSKFVGAAWNLFGL